ncbi:MAG: hypothetical protein ACXWGY_05350 [Chthoniobacterales bacterium]
MLPNKSIFRPLLVLLLGLALDTRADVMGDLHKTLSFDDPQNRFHLQLSGLIDLENYFIDQPAPGLLFTDHDYLFNPRFTLYLDATIGSKVYIFLQVRADRGFDPTDEGDAEIRADEYFLRYSFSKAVNVQVGKFATVVGNWVSRHDSWQNPFINAPLPYEHLLGIWDSAAPENVDDLFTWAHVGEYDNGNYSDKYLRLPIIWGPSYTSGVSVSGSLGKFDYAVEVKNNALASRPDYWSLTDRNFAHPTVSTHFHIRPNEMWNIGLSASSGPYLLHQANYDLPPGRDIGDYDEKVLAQDISFAWHHFQFWAECFETRFQVPLIGDADTIAYYLELKYKFAPQFFGALRWNQQLFGTVRDDTERAPWGEDVWRIDAALGYRFTDHIQAKLQYSLSHHDASLDDHEHLIATQLTLKY